MRQPSLSLRLLYLALAAWTALLLAACAGDDTSASGSGADAGTDAQPGAAVRVDPPSATVTADIGGAPSQPVSFRAYYQLEGGAEVDVTDDAQWIVSKPAVATVSAGTATPVGIGGVVTVSATHGGVTGSATLTVTLTGDVFLPGTDATTKDAFDAAAADSDPANAPALEYPEDGAVLPQNLPPIEAQWTQAADNNVYRLRLESPDVLDIALYTTARELLFPAPEWRTIAVSTPDAAIALTVDALGASGQRRTSASRDMTISADVIDESAIYVWQSSSGSFRVLDIIAGTDIPLPNDAPALAPGQPCSGCHRISRDGKRFAYTFNGSNFFIGTLAYDEQQTLFTQRIVPTAGVRGTYAAFNPLEDTTIPAMLLTVPDTVPNNTAGTVRLELVDPDTKAPISSDLAAALLGIDPAIGHATMMPDWSPAGDFVVFVAYNSDANFVRLLGDDVVLGSIVEAGVSFSGGMFHFDTPKVLVAATPGDNPDTGLNNFLPTISPDGAAVAFTRAGGWWSIKTQQSLLNLSGQIMLVRRADGQVFELVRGSNGPGTTWSSTWPQWAPTLGGRYAWLAYASERPYGHRLTTASPENTMCSLVQGQQQCKQLWITAVDREKFENGTADPSMAPFWIPGQTLSAQYVSPQWTKAVLPPPQ